MHMHKIRRGGGRKLEMHKLIPLLALGMFLSVCPLGHADQTNLLGPTGSGQFGATVTVLPNGNFVVTDPTYSTPGVTNAGAVYLYDGATLHVISTLHRRPS